MEREPGPHPHHLVMEVGEKHRPVTDVTFQPHTIILVFLCGALRSASVLGLRGAELEHDDLAVLQPPQSLDAQPPVAPGGHRDVDACLGASFASGGRPATAGGRRRQAAAGRRGRRPGSRGPLRPRGRDAGQGYKLYAIWGTRPVPEVYRVYPMNVSESKVSEEMIPQLTGGGYLLGDGEYDASPVFDAAGAAGYQLLARARIRRRDWAIAIRAHIDCGPSS